jgi:hypothetical protein
VIVYEDTLPRPTPRSTVIQPSTSMLAIARSMVRSLLRSFFATVAMDGKQLLPSSLAKLPMHTSTELSTGSFGPKSHTRSITLMLTHHSGH